MSRSNPSSVPQGRASRILLEQLPRSHTDHCRRIHFGHVTFTQQKMLPLETIPGAAGVHVRRIEPVAVSRFFIVLVIL